MFNELLSTMMSLLLITCKQGFTKGTCAPSNERMTSSDVTSDVTVKGDVALCSRLREIIKYVTKDNTRTDDGMYLNNFLHHMEADTNGDNPLKLYDRDNMKVLPNDSSDNDRRKLFDGIEERYIRNSINGNGIIPQTLSINNGDNHSNHNVKYEHDPTYAHNNGEKTTETTYTNITIYGNHWDSPDSSLPFDIMEISGKNTTRLNDVTMYSGDNSTRYVTHPETTLSKQSSGITESSTNYKGDKSTSLDNITIEHKGNTKPILHTAKNSTSTSQMKWYFVGRYWRCIKHCSRYM